MALVHRQLVERVTRLSLLLYFVAMTVAAIVVASAFLIWLAKHCGLGSHTFCCSVSP